jgi:transcriptional regulator with PAS, ATPase and Fis domain
MSNAKILIVGFDPAKLMDLERKLLAMGMGHELHTLLAGNEINIRKNIVEQVATVKPDLLIIEIWANQFPGPHSGAESTQPWPIGLEAVELMRKNNSSTPVAYFGADDEEFDKESGLRKRISETLPIFCFTATLSVSELEFAVVHGLKMKDHLRWSFESKETKEKRIRHFEMETLREKHLRKSFGDKLLLSSKTLALFLNDLSEAAYIKDDSLKYVYVNTAMAKLLDRSESDIIGLRDEELFGEQLVEHLVWNQQALLRGEWAYNEHVCRDLLPNLVLFQSTIPLRNASGRIVGVCGTWRDNTKRDWVTVGEVTTDHEYASAAMRSCLEKALKAAKSDSRVLLLGETGSGKDFVAQYVHEHSSRSLGQYFAINCAAIPAALAESELFGYERGSFTGAVGPKQGLLEQAEGGTLLLNEIGELVLPLQAKLLTSLDTMTFTRVGGVKEISFNARIIAATNRDLKKEVEAEQFREDLFHRLKVVCIELPPLRKRKKDIPILVRKFLEKLKKDLNLDSIPSIEPSAMDALCNYSWPGNVRELRNLLETAVIFSEHHTLSRKDFFPDDIDDATSSMGSQSVPLPTNGPYNDLINNFKRYVIQDALRRSAGQKAKAARLLEITRGTLYSQMEMLGMDVSQKDT